MSSRNGKYAVTLDLWLTLAGEVDVDRVTFRSPKRGRLRAEMTGAMLRGHGEDISDDRLEVIFRTAAERVNAEHDLGVDLLFRDRVAQVLSDIHPDLPGRLGPGGIDELSDVIDESFARLPPIVFDRTLEALAHLSRMPVSVALISNTGLTSPRAYRRWFDETGMLAHFEHLTFSNGVACAKPNRAIFDSTLEKVGVPASNALHVGDNLHTDVAGAAAAGMSTAWISGHDDRQPVTPPDYVAGDIGDVPGVVEAWLADRKA